MGPGVLRDWEQTAQRGQDTLCLLTNGPLATIPPHPISISLPLAARISRGPGLFQKPLEGLTGARAGTEGHQSPQLRTSTPSQLGHLLLSQPPQEPYPAPACPTPSGNTQLPPGKPIPDSPPCFFPPPSATRATSVMSLPTPAASPQPSLPALPGRESGVCPHRKLSYLASPILVGDNSGLYRTSLLKPH